MTVLSNNGEDIKFVLTPREIGLLKGYIQDVIDGESNGNKCSITLLKICKWIYQGKLFDDRNAIYHINTFEYIKSILD